MSLLLKLQEFLQGPQLDPLSRTLLRFVNGTEYDVSELHRGILLLGAQGEGKTTAIRSLLGAMLRAGYGGVVLVVKSDVVDEVLATASSVGRTRDVVVLRPESAHRFNPFEGVSSPAFAAEMLVEIAEGLGGKKSDDGDDWRQQRDMLLENLCIACLHLHGRIDAELLAALYDAVPHHAAGLETPAFKASPLGQLHRDLLAGALIPTVTEAARFLCVKFPGYPDRTQGSVRSMVLPIFHTFSRPNIAAIFRGESTISMDEVLNHRKVLLVDLPATTKEGKCANAALQYCFCKAALRLRRLTDAFLACDEFQETAGKVLMENLSLFRQYRVSPVLASQSLTAVEARIGTTACKTIVGLMRTVIFFGQNDTETNRWAEELIGEESYTKHSHSTSDGKRSTSSTKERRPKVYRDEFRRLKSLHSICARKGEYWCARWSLTPNLSSLPLKIKG